MKIDLFFEPEFDELYESYHNDSKKRELLKLEGISKEQLDVGRMSYNYFTGKIADMSVNQNANANEDFSPSSYAAEIVKGIQKLEVTFCFGDIHKESSAQKGQMSLFAPFGMGIFISMMHLV